MAAYASARRKVIRMVIKVTVPSGSNVVSVVWRRVGQVHPLHVNKSAEREDYARATSTPM
jgi:hypothetical protein